MHVNQNKQIFGELCDRNEHLLAQLTLNTKGRHIVTVCKLRGLNFISKWQRMALLLCLASQRLQIKIGMKLASMRHGLNYDIVGQ